MDSENTATSEVTVKKRGRKPGKRGRPKGTTTTVVKKKRGRKRGRPKTTKALQKPSSPAGRRRGRPAQTNATNQQVSNGIHLIGELLVVDVNLLGCTEVVFIGKAPKIR
jgi:hypothetical protein